jgi:predicted transcriptional regulator
VKDLTKAEEQVMTILWEIENGVVKDIIEKLPKPKPAYNTVSTVVRILEKKGVVAHKAFGKTHVYYPLLKKEEYQEHQTKGLLKRFYQNKPKSLVSYFVEQEEIDLKELEEIMKLLQDKKKKS